MIMKINAERTTFSRFQNNRNQKIKTTKKRTITGSISYCCCFGLFAENNTFIVVKFKNATFDLVGESRLGFCFFG